MISWIKQNWLWISSIIILLVGLYLVPYSIGIAYTFAITSIVLSMLYIHKISK